MTPSAPAMPTQSQPVMPADNATPASDASPAADMFDANDPEALENQNIFELLGVVDGTEAERESFLDELQQVIWEDMLENDVPQLITAEELTQLDGIKAQTFASELEKQEAIITFLEKIIPDLEEIMLEKALELKEDMMRERISGMREYYVNQAEPLQKIASAEELINSDKWRSAATILNALQS